MKTIDLGTCRLDLLDMDSACSEIKNLSRSDTFHYVVTPNMDHMERLYRQHKNGELSKIYQNAKLSLCDSRVLEKLLRILGFRVPEVVTGSALTEKLFEETITPEDKVLIVGGNDSIILKLRRKYPSFRLNHINPSMGFIRKDEEVKNLVRKISKNSAGYNYIFIAVGSPQQELLAAELAKKVNSGVALCIGASLLFLVGAEKRAPHWVQKLHIEWLFRLFQNPTRLASRYFSNLKYLPLIAGNIYKIKRAF